MQHTQTSSLPFEGHQPLWRAVTYISLAFGLVALFEFSPALLATLVFALSLLLALSERTEKLDREPLAQTYSARLFGDGGCFPSHEAEAEKPVSTAARVIDGGSLEHHR